MLERAPAVPLESRATILSAAWPRDPVVRWFWVAWLASLLPYSAYLWGGAVPYSYRDRLAFTLLGVLVAIACLVDFGKIADPESRRTRLLVAAAFLSWALEVLIEHYAWDGETGPLFALLELFFVVHYALLAALAIGSIRREETPAARTLRRLAQLETAIFAVGAFFYCVLLPARFDPHTAATYVPTAVFYVELDLVLLLLFAFRARRSQGGERSRWRWFELGALLVVAADALYLVSLLVPFDVDRLVWLDPLWFLPYPAVVIAARWPPLPATRAESHETTPTADPGLFRFAPGLLFAFLVPCLHLIFELVAGDEPSPAAQFQRLFALLLALALAALGAHHQALISRAHADLEREVAEARRRLATNQKLEAIGRLSAGVAHDFNNLLTVVLGRAELLRDRAEAPATRRDLDTIVRAAGRAAELTQELLAVGQRGMEVRERVDLGALVSASLPELAGICGESIEIETALASAELPVEIDPSHLERVMRNLASNARDAMPGGGRLTIATERRRVKATERVRDDVLAAGDYAVLVFRDRGSGMDEETLRRLFEPFFTTKALGRGTGLGLATAYGLVRQNGGQIVVSSRVDDGASFEVLLPLASGAPAGERPGG